MLNFDEDKHNSRLKDLRKKEEEDLAQIIASRHGLGYADLSSVSISGDALKTVDEKDAREANIAPFTLKDNRLKVAILSPADEKTQMALKELERKGYINELYVASTLSLARAWETYKELNSTHATSAGSVSISNDEIVKVIDSKPHIEDIQKSIAELLENKSGYRTSRILEYIIAGALATEASDIHIEPEEGYTRVRYRLDGVLNDVVQIDLITYNLILSRIKLISGLKLNIKKDSQDGRFSIKLQTKSIEVRTSILPGAYSESIVMRILNPDSIAVPFESLGIEPKLMEVFLREIARPEGMILTTGPTGSGKTTTLYAFLRKIHSPDVKIITIEDPIEYHLPGIVQTQVNEEGYTFLDGLRAALRQDPEIIMVGEIRDSETAKIAINSAQTGHLVFSTLHTNSAAGAFPRLIDLGVNPNVITSSINLVIGQRLVRCLCKFCKKEVPIEGETKALIDRIYARIPEDFKGVQTEKMWMAVGCLKCNKTGYKSRTGIHEVILTKDSAVEAQIVRQASAREIAETARSQKIPNLAEDGILKVLSGTTSLDEVQRVVDIQ